MTRCDDAAEAPPAPARRPRGRHPHAAAARDRAQLLAIAEELAGSASRTGRDPSHFAVAHVSMGDLARAAGVSRSALYRLWPSRQDLWDELVQHVLTRAGGGAPQPPAPGPVPVAMLEAAQDVLLADPLPLLRTGVVGYPPGDGRADVLGTQRDEMVTLLEAGLDAHLGGRRRPAAGLTTTDLATAVTVVGNGLPLTARLAGVDAVQLGAMPSGRRSGLLAVLSATLVAQLTEDIPPGTGPGPMSARRPPTPEAGGRGPGAGRRAHYLSVAAGLALRPAPDGLDRVLGHVTLDDVARAAGVTRRTLTNVWPDLTAFRLDLFSHLLAGARRGLVEAIAAAIPHPDGGRDPRAAFLLVGDTLQRRLIGSAAGASWLAFAPHLDTPPLAERARQDHDALVDDCTRAVRRLLAAAARRPRPGVSLRGLALALTTIADGTDRVARTCPELLRADIPRADGPDAQGHHSLTGVAVAAVLTALTEPLDTSRPVVDLARLLA